MVGKLFETLKSTFSTTDDEVLMKEKDKENQDSTLSFESIQFSSIFNKRKI